MVRDPADGKARLLVVAYPPEQNLERPVLDKRWKASPASRMTELLHATGVRVGLITNGEHWMLVDAPRWLTIWRRRRAVRPKLQRFGASCSHATSRCRPRSITGW